MILYWEFENLFTLFVSESKKSFSNTRSSILDSIVYYYVVASICTGTVVIWFSAQADICWLGPHNWKFPVKTIADRVQLYMWVFTDYGQISLEKSSEPTHESS